MVRDKFERFLQHRQSLLYQYKMGDLTKNEFIEENYRAIERLGIEPFKKADNIKKSIYNYHYYNVLAKFHYRLSKDYPAGSRQWRHYILQSNYYYYEKDKATMTILKLLDYKNIDAYFVKVRSKKLKNKLFEIVIRDPEVLMEINTLSSRYDGMEAYDLVLHSKNPVILKNLQSNGVFRDEKIKSLADSYINQIY